MKTPLNLPKIILSLFVLSIIALSSCSKHTTKQVYEYEKEATTEVTKDSLYTHTPNPNTIEAEKDIDIAPCPPCPQTQTQPKPQSQPQSQPKPQSQPNPQSISTDTLWVYGTYANSYAFIRKNKLVHGMVEGKQFDILLKNITTERNTYKELYRNEVEKIVVEKKTWKKDLVIVLLLLLLIFVIAQKSIRR